MFNKSPLSQSEYVKMLVFSLRDHDPRRKKVLELFTLYGKNFSELITKIFIRGYEQNKVNCLIHMLETYEIENDTKTHDFLLRIMNIYNLGVVKIPIEESCKN
jgi:hypothetical protein